MRASTPLIWFVILANMAASAADLLFAFVAASKNSGGDFTWQFQELHRHLYHPLLVTWTVVMLLSAVVLRGFAGRTRRVWFLGLCAQILAVIVTIVFRHPLAVQVASWDANQPPPNWPEISAHWCIWSVITLPLTAAATMAWLCVALTDSEGAVIRPNVR